MLSLGLWDTASRDCCVAADSAPVASGIFAAHGVAALGVNAGDGTSTIRLVLELDDRSRAPCSRAVVGLEETLSQGVNIFSGFIRPLTCQGAVE